MVLAVLMRKSSNVEHQPFHARRVSNSGRKLSKSITRHNASRIRNRAHGVRVEKRVIKEQSLPTPPQTPVIQPLVLDATPAPANDGPVGITQFPVGTAAYQAARIVNEYPAMRIKLQGPVPQNFGQIDRVTLNYADPTNRLYPLSYIRDLLALPQHGPA